MPTPVIASWFWVVLVSTLTGCGENHRAPPSLDAGPPPEDIIVHGTSVTHFVSDDGVHDRPLDYPFTVPVVASGSQVPANLGVGFTAFIPAADLATVPTIAPVITPVRNVLIGGMDLTAPRTAVGLTPTVTWTAPAMGTPTGYRLVVEDVTTDAANHTVLDQVAELRTASTELHIPPSVLASGHSYVLVISADIVPGADGAAAPFLATGIAQHRVSLATAQFTP